MSDTEIRGLMTRLYQSWADNDADAFAAFYTEGATVVLPGVFRQGRAAIREHMAAGFDGPLKGSRAVDEPQDIRVAGDTAIAVSRGGVLFAGEDSVPEAREIVATWVFTRRGGEWAVAAYSNAAAH
ncbi:SgcJ/EcaC family oxidoreductase [Amycolatopsis saalfeldensis]|uniref:DUF4440 domain-containing protein n=1 Tax=Amycolatopsis saalfeldensis TaxID=394193 RepID=A0A1H8YQI2_9PSEU|nr:SgcJ/EcaC family oxidoreductase [Amycolatopsis saalfeldensis]SEP54389.1 conserved hypothetical protein [Amycolatopsis saalfeldensis]